MLTIILIGMIKPNCEREFERRISDLFRLISAEPGCRGVTWGPTENSGEYALIERYVDDAALMAHRTSSHMKEYGPLLSALFDGPPKIARFIEQGEHFDK
jgi:quinol monooxygenase YgiN